MRTIYSYRIRDYDKFLTGFAQLVDTSVDSSDFVINPKLTSSDYFGTIQFGKFTIYRPYSWFLYHGIVLKINGEITETHLCFDIIYPRRWVFIANAFFISLFSFFVMSSLDLYVGLAILLVIALQFSLLFRFYAKCKSNFIRTIEEILIIEES